MTAPPPAPEGSVEELDARWLASLFETDSQFMRGLVDWLRLHNPANQFAYHNTNHCVSVANRVIRLARSHPVSTDQVKTAAAAALWHDFDHRGMAQANQDGLGDRPNIERAVAGYSQHASPSTSPGWLDDAAVVRLIGDTYWPHKTAADLSGQIIQDADLLQAGVGPHRRLWSEAAAIESGFLPEQAVYDFTMRHIDDLNLDQSKRWLIAECPEYRLEHEEKTPGQDKISALFALPQRQAMSVRPVRRR